ncbi:50S ribosomal protein L25/general stress protein Ctc [Paenactinomyces guangxiensis]|uniref:Large ribosomal subunit protein bL25 n=1 Tax=Paenactinomyces guangxiensis TaxID=1490290 RepID=A0A7W1WTK7_9BACL|nr:50S ribosomal protein L25/general stress protein Ctc [Paenactinomyces guangxiensis]MBA4495820.1 50S ribosomal protein L25/general stress protein Ctc [Paenactinomyces guangxiensis]MBH8592910.1 50S ribosomal protein L25/general stress protein Ctc [Paenactinomyces guangxiensis]
MSATIYAEERAKQTRSALNQLRKQGRVPAVIYGKGENYHIHLDENEFRKQLASAKSLLNIKLNNQLHSVMVREIQKEPVKAEILHIDFQKVEMGQPVETEVPLHLTGEAAGVKAGGILQQPLRTVQIRCLPDRIPQELTFDVSSLEAGEVVTLKELSLPEGIELLSDPDTVVASIVAPQAEKAEDGGETEGTPEENRDNEG